MRSNNTVYHVVKIIASKPRRHKDFTTRDIEFYDAEGNSHEVTLFTFDEDGECVVDLSEWGSDENNA